MRWRSLPRIVRWIGAVAGILLAIAVTVALLFGNLIVNSLVKPRLVSAFTEAFPHYELHLGTMTVGIFSNRVACDSIAVQTRDTAWSAHCGAFAVSGIDWWSVFLKGRIAPEDLATSVLEMKQGMYSTPGSVYELHFDSLRVSVADSLVVMTLVSWSPSGEDEELFASSRFRHTRVRMEASRIDIAGVACVDVLQGTRCQVRSIRLGDPAFDILINKDKPSFSDTVHPRMPTELLSSVAIPLRIDSLIMTHASLHYGERFAVGGRPAVITFDSVQIGVEGMANAAGGGDTIVVQVGGRFMNAGMMSCRMTIPLAHQGLAYRYAGSLSRMSLAALNPFLERAEQMRITEGVLQDAAFTIVVTDGRARGSVRAIYHDLTVAVIDKQTGSAEGILDRIVSLISNRVKIRRNNLAERSGASALGTVRYDHKSSEAFVEFSWFALRSGVGNVVGF